MSSLLNVASLTLCRRVKFILTARSTIALVSTESKKLIFVEKDHQPDNTPHPKIIDLDRFVAFFRSLPTPLFSFGNLIVSFRTQKSVCDAIGSFRGLMISFNVEGLSSDGFSSNSFRRSCKSITSRRWFACASPATRRTCWKVLVLKSEISPTKMELSHRPTLLTNGSKY